MSSHLAVAPGEALAAGTGVVKGVAGVVGGGQGQARAPVEAGLALTESQAMAGPGWTWPGRAWDVQGQLGGVDPDPAPAAAASEQEQKDERRGTAANARHRPHPRALCCLSPALGVLPVPQQHLRGRVSVRGAERRRVQRQWGGRWRGGEWRGGEGPNSR